MVINFADRYGIKRRVKLDIAKLPASPGGWTFKRYLVDKEHSNIWHDRSRAELETVESGVSGDPTRFAKTFDLWSNAVTLLVLDPVRR